MGLKFCWVIREVFVETVSEPTPERLKASMFRGTGSRRGNSKHGGRECLAC